MPSLGAVSAAGTFACHIRKAVDDKARLPMARTRVCADGPNHM